MQQPHTKAISLLIFLCTVLVAGAQDSLPNNYGLHIINSIKALRKSIAKNPSHEMVAVTKKLPGVVLDLRYATAANFTGVQLYPATASTYLRLVAADSLRAVQKELGQMGLGLKIFDAYRPFAATEKMWALVMDERYTANPKYGSGHNRGVAVDLTLIDSTSKKELPMGTGFDNFTDTAHHSFANLPENILQNRRLLRSLMEKHGFKALESEWWHYYLPNAKDFALLNLGFAQLRGLQPFRKKKHK